MSGLPVELLGPEPKPYLVMIQPKMPYRNHNATYIMQVTSDSKENAVRAAWRTDGVRFNGLDRRYQNATAQPLEPNTTYTLGTK